MDTTHDPVNPTHYAIDEGVIECIDYIESHAFDFLEGNVIKYVTRYQHKNGVEDLKKARWYLNRLIQRYESRSTHDQKIYESVLNCNDFEFQFPNSETLDETSEPA
jgi:hypothetical protein